MKLEILGASIEKQETLNSARLARRDKPKSIAVGVEIIGSRNTFHKFLICLKHAT